MILRRKVWVKSLKKDLQYTQIFLKKLWCHSLGQKLSLQKDPADFKITVVYCLKNNKKETTVCQNPWATGKAILKGKIIPSNALIYVNIKNRY